MLLKERSLAPTSGAIDTEPSSWGEIYSDSLDSIKKSYEFGSRSYVKELAYDERLDAIEKATGEKRENPMRVYLDPVPGSEQMIPQRDWLDEDRFQTWLGELSEKHPDKRDIIAPETPISERAFAIGHQAEAKELSTWDRGAPGLGKYVPYTGAMLAAALTDPLNVQSFALGPWGRVGQGAKQIVWNGLKVGAVNAGIETVAQPSIQQWRKDAGLEYGVSHAALNIAAAGLLGFGLDAGIRTAYRGGQRVLGREAVLDDEGKVVSYRRRQAPTEALDEAAGRQAPESPIRKALEGDEAALIQAARELGATSDPAVRGAVEELERYMLFGRPPEVDAGEHDLRLADAIRASMDPEAPPPGDAVRGVGTPPRTTYTEDDYLTAWRSLGEDPSGLSPEEANVRASMRQAIEDIGLHAGLDEAEVRTRVRKLLKEDASRAEGLLGTRAGTGAVSLRDARALPDTARPGETLSLEGKPVEVRNLDPSRSSLDPDSLTKRTEGRGVAVAFERSDGTMLVQRQVRAMEAEAQPVAYVFREADGWSPDDARVYAAQQNLKEMSGSPLDMATILRARPELANRSLPLSDYKFKQAIALSRLSDEAFATVQRGDLPANRAAVVGDLVTDPSRHLDLITELSKANLKSAEQTKLFLGQLLAQPVASDLHAVRMGVDAAVRDLLPERTQILDKGLKALKIDKRVFGMLDREAQRIESAGNILERDVNRARVDLSDRLVGLVETLANVQGPVNDALQAAAMAVARGVRLKTAVDAFVRRIGDLYETDGLDGILKARAETTDLAPRKVDDPFGAEARLQVEELEANRPSNRGRRFALPDDDELEKWAEGVEDAGRPGRDRGPRARVAETGEEAAQGERGAAEASGSGADRGVLRGSGEGAQPAGRGTGTRGAGGADEVAGGEPSGRFTFGLAGFDGRVEETRAFRDGARVRHYFLYKEGHQTPKGKGKVALNVMRSVHNWQARMRIVERSPGQWEIERVKVRKNVRGKGLGPALYDAVERDLGVVIKPSGFLTDDGYRFWLRRRPESVQYYRQIEGTWLSPKRLISYKVWINQVAEQAKDAAYIARLAKTNDKVNKALAQLPPESVLPERMKRMFALDVQVSELDERGFFSPSLEAAKRIPQATGTVQQMRAMLLNAGAKPKELEAVGFDKAFPDPQAKVSRADIEQFLRDNRVTLGSNWPGDLPAVQQRMGELNKEMAAIEGAPRTKTNQLSNEPRWLELKREYDSLSRQLPGSGRFEQWATPGGIPGSYREVVTTLQPKEQVGPLGPKGWAETHNSQARDGDVNYTSSHWPGITNPLLHYRVKDFSAVSSNRAAPATDGSVTPAPQQGRGDPGSRASQPGALTEPAKIRVLDELQSDWAQRARDQGIRGADQEQKVAAAEQAKQDFFIVRDEAMRYVGIEPHAGDMGHGADNLVVKAKALLQSKRGDPKAADLNQRWMAAENTYFDLSNKAASREGVPSAPYISNTSDWVDLGLKQALIDAASDPSVTKFAWAPGKVQADRYNLAKNVSALRYSPETGGLMYQDRKGSIGQPNWLGIQNPENTSSGAFTPENLHTAIGKEMAEKLLAAPKQGMGGGSPYQAHTLAIPEGMQVGGEGMKSFYGDFNKDGSYTPGIVGTRLLKLVKQLDPEAAKIEAHILKVDAAKSKPSFAVRDRNGQELGRFDDYEQAMNVAEDSPGASVAQSSVGEVRYPSISITPKLREKLLGGMPMFALPVAEPSPVSLTSMRRSDYNITPFAEREMSAIKAEIDAVIDRLPSGIKARVEDRLIVGGRSVDGMFDPHEMMIYLALNDKAARTARHEEWHVLEELGFLIPQETAIVWGKAERDGLRAKYAIDERYRPVYAKQFGDDEQAIEAALRSETMARMRADWELGARFGKTVDSILKRISEFFERVRNLLAGRGYQSAADVFELIDKGEVGTRKPPISYWLDAREQAGRTVGGRFALKDDPFLAREAKQLTEDITKFEGALWKANRSAEEIAAAIFDRYGLHVKAEDIATRQVWWRVKETYDGATNPGVLEFHDTIKDQALASEENIYSSRIATDIDARPTAPQVQGEVEGPTEFPAVGAALDEVASARAAELWKVGTAPAAIAKRLSDESGKYVRPMSVLSVLEARGLITESPMSAGVKGKRTPIAKMRKAKISEVVDALGATEDMGLPAAGKARALSNVLGAYVPPEMLARAEARAVTLAAKEEVVSAIDTALRAQEGARKTPSEIAEELSQKSGQRVSAMAVFYRRQALREGGEDIAGYVRVWGDAQLNILRDGIASRQTAAEIAASIKSQTGAWVTEKAVYRQIAKMKEQGEAAKLRGPAARPWLNEGKFQWTDEAVAMLTSDEVNGLSADNAARLLGDRFGIELTPNAIRKQRAKVRRAAQVETLEDASRTEALGNLTKGCRR